MSLQVARVALHYADGSTKAESGDCLVVAPGCTFHVNDMYPMIYAGWAQGVDFNAVRRNWCGELINAAPAEAVPPASAGGAAAPSSATTTTTTTTTSAATTTTTTTTTSA